MSSVKVTAVLLLATFAGTAAHNGGDGGGGGHDHATRVTTIIRGLTVSDADPAADAIAAGDTVTITGRSAHNRQENLPTGSTHSLRQWISRLMCVCVRTDVEMPCKLDRRACAMHPRKCDRFQTGPVE